MNTERIAERVARSVLSQEETFVPPKSAQNAAKKALRWKDEHGSEVKAMTQTGWTRARQLANGDSLSYDIVKRMAQFNRHRKNSKVSPEHKDEPWKDNGYVAWLGWGGTTGVDWAAKVVERVEKKRQSSLAERVVESFVAARGVQRHRKDKDLMRDTGGTSKGREREPDQKPPRDDSKERYKDKKLKPEERDKDTQKDPDEPIGRKMKRRGSVHPLDRQVESNWGFPIEEDNYHRKVFGALWCILENEESISEKDFSGQDWIRTECDRVVRMPEAEEIIQRMEEQGCRPSFCAEAIFNQVIGAK
jgi:hypothetical protein